ncbi:MAG: hypothetical protein Q4C15_07175 [Eubacteriales bacterium]|nr:hypothetical protein [Eubacteriales bacterium]
MKCKRVISAVVCLAVVAGCSAGFAGCDNTEKDREAISKVIDDCADAFRDDDAEAFLELTCWDEDDKDYRQIEEYMNYSIDEDYRECYDLIFDTIEIDYDVDDIEVNGDKASVKVKYEIIDLSEVDFKVANLNLTFKDAVKDTKETSSIKAKIDFELEKGEWKIKKITNLDKLFAFMVMINPPEYVPTPVPDPTETQPTVPDPTDTQPVTTEPSETTPTTAFADSYDKAVKAFIEILEQNRDAIWAVESTFGIEPVGLYDLDGNGLPEFFLISDDGNEYSATLHIYEYNEYAGEAIEIITSPEFITQGQASSFMLYLTDKELIVTYTYGESYYLHVSTDMYALGEREGGIHKWDLCETYAREIVTDYDPETDTETTTRLFYHNSGICTEEEYMPAMKDFTARTVISLHQKFVLSSNYPEYGLLSKPSNRRYNYTTMHDYLESLIA